MTGPAVLVCAAHAGSACPPREIRAALAIAGIEIARVEDVKALGDAPLGQRWLDEGIRLAIAAGGDGTVGTVVNHLGAHPIALGIVPLGTANDCARSLGIPLGLDAADAIAGGRLVPIDVGEVADGAGRRARFVQAAIVGLHADFARLATDIVRRERFGALNYPVAAVEALATARARELVLTLDDGTVIGGSALQIAAMNMPHVMGGTLDIDLPAVDPQDGRLTFLVVRSLVQIERHLARGARIEAVGEPAEASVDGEIGFVTPLEVRLVSPRIRVVVPR